VDGGTEVSRAVTPRYEEGRLRFGRLLASALKGRGMKQEDLAGMLGTTQSSVSGWINGKYEPAAETVFAIERTLSMDPGFLSRPLGYLPVEAISTTIGVEAAIAHSPLLADDDKVVLVSLYELLAAKRQDATAPRKASVDRRRVTTTPRPAAKRPAPARTQPMVGGR
jgi:transcriptional regulator with XRE-family HTH domain